MLWHFCNKWKDDAQKYRNKHRTNKWYFIYIKGKYPIPLKTLHIQKKCNQSSFLFVNEINGLISKSLKTLMKLIVAFRIRFMSNQIIAGDNPTSQPAQQWPPAIAWQPEPPLAIWASNVKNLSHWSGNVPDHTDRVKEAYLIAEKWDRKWQSVESVNGTRTQMYHPNKRLD